MRLDGVTAAGENESGPVVLEPLILHCCALAKFVSSPASASVFSRMVLAAALLLAGGGTVAAPASADVLVKNLGQTNISQAAALARIQSFTAGTYVRGYTVSSVQVDSDDSEGDSFGVSVCSANQQAVKNMLDCIDFGTSVCTVTESRRPPSNCTDLTAPDDFDAGNLTFTAPTGTKLQTGKRYALLLTVNSDTVDLGVTSYGNEDPDKAEGWSIANRSGSKAGNSNPIWVSSSRVVRIAINGGTDTVVDVTDVEVTSTPIAAADTYSVGEKIQITVTFEDNVTVTGRPEFEIKLGSTETRRASYVSGTGTTALVFEYTVQSQDRDDDGIWIDADALKLNGGTIQDGDNNDANLDHAQLGKQEDHKVNGSDITQPRIASIERHEPRTSPTNADSLTWRVTFNEQVENVDATDFTMSGTTATLTLSEVTAATVYDVTASGGDLDNLEATVTLSFSNNKDITDTASNDLTKTMPTGVNDNTYVMDNTAPTIVRALATGTSLSITFTDDLASSARLANAAFTVKKTVSGVEQAVTLIGSPSISGKVVTLTLSSEVISSDTDVKVSYTVPVTDNDNRLEDLLGNEVNGFTDRAVINMAANTPATGEPVIEGFYLTGYQLTAGLGTIADADGLPGTIFPVGYSLQWVRQDNRNGGNEETVGTGQTYTLVSDDEDKYIALHVTFTDNEGFPETHSVVTSDTVQPYVQLYIAFPPVSEPYKVNEGETLTLTAQLEYTDGSPAPAPFGFSVWFSSVDDEATASDDYSAVSHSYTIAKGATTIDNVTVQTIQDDASEGDENFLVNIDSRSNYGWLQIVNAREAATVRIIDDDDPEELAVSSSDVNVDEGSEAAYTVALAAPPAADVTVSVASDDTTAATVAPASLTFTTANWSEAQTVTVTGVEDTDQGDESVTITHSGTKVAAKTVTVTVRDTTRTRQNEIAIQVYTSYDYNEPSYIDPSNIPESGTANITIGIDWPQIWLRQPNFSPPSLVDGKIVFTAETLGMGKHQSATATEGVDFTATSQTFTYDSSLEPNDQVFDSSMRLFTLSVPITSEWWMRA